MRSDLVIVKYPDKKIEEAFLLEAASKFTTAFGYAFKGKGVIENDTFDGAEFDVMDTITKVCDERIKDRVFFHLIQVDDKDENDLPKFDPDSIQPFNVVTKGDNTLVSLMLSGVFEQFSHEADENTPEYHAVREILGDKMQAIYEQGSGSLAKMLQLLDTPLMRKEMRTLLLPRGEIHVIPAEGEGLTYSENPDRAEFDWGYASNSLGFEPKKPISAEAEVPAATTTAAAKPKSLAERKAALAAAGSVPSVTPPKEPLHLPAQKELPKDGPYYLKEVEPGKTELWLRPSKGSSHESAKKFWSHNCTMSRPPTPEALFKGFSIRHLKKDAPLRAGAEKLGLLKPETAFRDAMSKAQEGAPKVAAAAVDSMAKHLDEDQLKRETPLLLPAEEKQKILALQKAGIASMEDVAKEVAEYPTFTEQLAVPLHVVLNWRTKVFEELQKRSLISLIDQLRMELHGAKPELFDEPEGEAKEEVAEPVVVTPAKPKSLAERKAALASKQAA